MRSVFLNNLRSLSVLGTRQFVLCIAIVIAPTSSSSADTKPLSVEELGERVFYDVNLSKNRNQACATCHDPKHAFIDPRINAAKGSASVGSDGQSFGDRNAPTLSYIGFTPWFRQKMVSYYYGGFFHDGRATFLSDQAGGPPLSAIEMGLTDKAMAIARIRENPEYVSAFRANFGPDVFDDVGMAYYWMTKSIEAFERTSFFAPFDSKYDRHLKGDYVLTEQEKMGKALFFSDEFHSCHRCHQLQSDDRSPQEPFSSYQYHNIGVPINAELRRLNGKPADYIDDGLYLNPTVGRATNRGKFKTPTLRNIAVTGPYMHNGVFKDLKTVVKFYNQYASDDPKFQINPETGKPWDKPEIVETISLKSLRQGRALDEQQVDALVAFLRLLTDKRYEHLLE